MSTKSYAKSVTIGMFANFYVNQATILTEILPRRIFEIVCLIRAALDFTQKSRYVVLPYLELCITPRCSLRCTNCANLMQYYAKPCDYETEGIIGSIKRLLECVDYIDCFRILGGEPFLHRDIASIISFCTAQGKLRQVQIVTNGTIVPEQEVLKSLQHPKASVYISDYGKYSVNKSRLETCLAAYGIESVSDLNYTWDDMGGVERRDYSPERVRSVYRGCRDICKTLVEGLVYVCPRAAHADKLGIVPRKEQDCVDLYNGSTSFVRRKLLELYNVEYVEACYYCNAVEDRSKIAAGEQCVTSPALTRRKPDGE